MPFGYRDSHIIEKVIKNNNGDVIGYALENGDIIMKEEAVSMAASGTISGVSVEVDDNGEEYLKNATGDPSDNMIEMPVVPNNTLD